MPWRLCFQATESCPVVEPTTKSYKVPEVIPHSYMSVIQKVHKEAMNRNELCDSQRNTDTG